MLSEKNKNVYITIPSLNPTEELYNYIKELNNNGFNNIIVINDGSNEEYDKIYDNILSKFKCIFIKHEINKGKGAALKSGLNYYYNLSNRNDFIGIITVDSDGQHSVKDVVKIYNSLKSNKDKLILGTRDFTKDNIPKKSEFGNNLTSQIFKILYKKNIKDTQTGLRGIPNSLIESFLYLEGNRYEYETEMLINCIENNIDFEEIPIETIYINNNSETHFRPVKDSIKIYWRIFHVFFKYILASVSSFILDLILFKILFNILNKLGYISLAIFISTIIARICSSLLNYTLNKKIAFKSDKSIITTIIKYYILVFVQMIISATLVTILYKIFGTGELIIKIVVDTLIFIVNYKIQKKYIF